MEFPIECRWRIISLGRSGPMKDEDKVQAIHLMVDAQIRDGAEEDLQGLYSSSASKFPLGVTMRFVPIHDRHTSPRIAQKCRELWARQRNFAANMGRCQSWEIASLDSKGRRHGNTLRELIMFVFRSARNPARKLFHSVDRRDPKGPVKFTFHPSDADEAHAAKAALIPRLRYHL